MRSEHQQRVEQFMRMAEQDVPFVPTTPSEETRLLRARLILEEAFETIEALGVVCGTEDSPLRFGDLRVAAERTFDLEGVIDGCCDLKVVTTGTLSACGIPDMPFQDEVDAANLRKFGPGGYRDEFGKWRKPPDFVPPDHGKILAELYPDQFADTVIEGDGR